MREDNDNVTSGKRLCINTNILLVERVVAAVGRCTIVHVQSAMCASAINQRLCVILNYSVYLLLLSFHIHIYRLWNVCNVTYIKVLMIVIVSINF